MIKTGEKKNFIFMPWVGLIEAGESTDDATERIKRAINEMKVEDEKKIMRLKRKYPNRNFAKIKNKWYLI